MKTLATLLAVLLASAPAHAEKMMRGPGDGACGMQTQVNLQVSYNLKANSFAEAQKMVADQNAKIQQMAEQQKLTKFKLQSENSNISSQPNYNPDGSASGFVYQVSGSLSYVLTDNAEASRFADFLTGQKMQVNLNSSTYRNC